MNSEDRTTILPATGRQDGVGGRAARRAAARRRGSGRRGRRRGGLGPIVAVVAAVAGTGVIAALAGAGFAVYRGEEGTDGGQQAVAYEALIAAEAGDHDGIQVPGAGAVDPAAVAAASPAAGDPARAATAAPATGGTSTGGTSTAPSTTPLPSASAAVPGPSGSAAPVSGSGTPRNPAASTSASATAKPESPAATTVTTAPAKPSATSARPTSTAGPGGSNSQYAQQVADLVNTQRAQAGCGPLTVDSRLNTAAQVHSEDMANRSYFDHASPEGNHADQRIEATGYRWSSWGENIARGQKDPAAVMESWMNSPGHRANILNCSFKQIGVGVRTGSGGPWWTQVFASPS
ncbi:CAP domain-containing protein [Kitasatospora sp. NPDC058406]|uniref:CAP domain-containing protein n=1 Tax=Kitasatospora sp. NPDC058406 TaxID=3346483 RepID=UPI00364CA791